MSRILSALQLSLDSAFDGLVPVSKTPPRNIPFSEQRIIQDAYKIDKNINFIFFRRFMEGDVRTSQAVAYIIDNNSNKSSGKLSNDELAKLHHTLWLNGTIPLLYVDNDDKVDILSCAAEPVSAKVKNWNYRPLDTILLNAQNINEQIRRFSASRLADGTFWEDERNKGYINSSKSAHNILLAKIKHADKKIDGENNPVARRLLLITLLIKYLEDRGVFRMEKGFFSKYVKGAESFYDILDKGTIDNIETLLKRLEGKFNGDIFVITKKKSERITRNMIKEIVNVVRADMDDKKQLYFWDIYNFEHIPVEVISHIYQYFTAKKEGAVFTPLLLVNLMVDQVMPLEKIKGNEKIFDPTCGSGIFLVSAFRRLIYTNKRKNKGWLTPQNLVELLENTIYGVELQEEAAHITSFSLALAVCDALQPKIIWSKLRFRKTIDRNIFVGDFGRRGKDALKASKSEGGFSIILGNPPFVEKLTPAIDKDLIENNKQIPANQLAYYILEACVEKYLSKSGKICMIQPYGFLYNAKVTTWRCNFINKFTVTKILDFISVNGLFYDANTKAIAIQIQKKKPVVDNIISHLTFRRTIAINEKICFELDHYDYHHVLQEDATNNKYSWKANLLGGGRLMQLAKHLGELPTIQKYIDDKGWSNQEGYTVGNQKNDAGFLFNKPLLLPDALTTEGINENLLGRVQLRKLERPRDEKIYYPPLMVIEEREALRSGLWNNGVLAYTSEFIGVNVHMDEEIELIKFFEWFKKNGDVLRPCLHLFGGRMLTARSTASKKEDIMNLPCPDSGNFDLVPWEKELLNDISDYMAEYVRTGQDSKLLLKMADDNDLQNYSQTFLRLMNKTNPNLKKCKELNGRDFRLVAFSFSGNSDSLSELNGYDWLETLSSLIEKKDNDTLRTQRVVRVYTGDTVIIVKPNKLRYWIRSAAIRDVDDVIGDIFGGGK